MLVCLDLRAPKKQQMGFTIVELLIVIVVIGILAAITLTSFSTVQDQAKASRAKDDLTLLTKAIKAGRINQSKTLNQITGSSWTGGSCFGRNTNLAALPKSDACWVDYQSALTAIAGAASTQLEGLMNGDPYGAPYYIDENELPGYCVADTVGDPFSPKSSGYDYYSVPYYNCS